MDLILPRQETTPKTSYSGYIAALRKRMKYAHGVVEDRIKRKGDARKEWYNKKVWGATLMPGDQVFLRRLGLQGKNKLADRWEEEVNKIPPSPCLPFDNWMAMVILGLSIAISCCQWGLCLLLQSITLHQQSLIHPWWRGHMLDRKLLVPTTLVLLMGRQILITQGALCQPWFPSIQLVCSPVRLILALTLIRTKHLCCYRSHSSGLTTMILEMGFWMGEVTRLMFLIWRWTQDMSLQMRSNSQVFSPLVLVLGMAHLVPSFSDQGVSFGVDRSLLGWGLECRILVRVLFTQMVPALLEIIWWDSCSLGILVCRFYHCYVIIKT